MRFETRATVHRRNTTVNSYTNASKSCVKLYGSVALIVNCRWRSFASLKVTTKSHSTEKSQQEQLVKEKEH